MFSIHGVEGPADVSPTLILVLLAAFFVLCLLSPYRFNRGKQLKGLPVIGSKYFLEPGIVTRYRWVLGANDLLKNGTEKTNDAPFTIIRPDSTITVVPKRYINELRNVPRDTLDGMKPQAEDFMGKYTGMDLVTACAANHEAFHKGLTPRLESFLPGMKLECDYGFDKYLPSSQEWTAIEVPKITVDILKHVIAWVWMGAPLCRNDDFLDANIAVVPEIFKLVMIMRLLPKPIQAVAGLLLPLQHRLNRIRAKAEGLCRPILEERMNLSDEEKAKRPQDLLGWWVDFHEGPERELNMMAQRFSSILTLGSLYATSSALNECIYALCACPEYVEPLREEITRVLKEENQSWNNATLRKLSKLDSFMKETVRVNPVTSVAYRRLVRKPVTFSDGFSVPIGTIICMNASPDDLDPLRTASENPKSRVFDGFRYHNQKASSVNPNTARYDFTSTDTEHLAFGLGKSACPGRFVAAAEIKIFLAKLLLDFDVRFVPRIGLPKKIALYDLFFRDPSTSKIEIRRRAANDL